MSYDTLEYLWQLPEKPKAAEDLPLGKAAVVPLSPREQAEGLEALAQGPEAVREFARRHGMAGCDPKFIAALEKSAGELVECEDERGWLKKLFAKARG